MVQKSCFLKIMAEIFLNPRKKNYIQIQMKVKEESEKVALKFNIQKTKIKDGHSHLETRSSVG